MIDRRRPVSQNPLVRAAGSILIASAIGGCTATAPSSTMAPSSTAAIYETVGPSPIETETAAPTDTPAETETAAPTDTPAETDTPEPSVSPLRTVAGQVLGWVAVPLPAGLVAGVDSTFQNALFGWSGGYLALHEDLLSGSIVPWTSSDGRSWQLGHPLDMAGLDNGAAVEEIVEGPAGLLALGRPGGCVDDGTGCIPEPATALWTSTDGRGWTRVDLQKAFGDGVVGDVSAGPKGYMAVSRSSDSGTSPPAVWLSVDGRVWRAASLSSVTFNDAYLARATVLGDGFLVAGRVGSLEGYGGGYFPSTMPAIWWSADGSDWSRETLPNVTEAPQAEAAIATVGGGKLVAHVVSWDCSCPPEGVTQAWTSSNGRAWKAVETAFPSPAVVLSDGRQALQVVPADGVLTVATSSDGFAWARIAVSGSGPADLADEAYGPRGLLVEGSDGSMWLATVSKAAA